MKDMVTMKRSIRMAVAMAVALASMSGLRIGRLEAQVGAPTKAVLVTGASSGIGRSITELLARKGYFVYAGARTDKDLQALDAIPNVKGVQLDVTKPDQIAAAVETVRRG